MKNKRGIELSVNFIVVLVLSLVIFGFGLKILSDIIKESEDITKRPIDDFDREVGELTCPPGERVCISPRQVTLNPGEYEVFGVKVMNHLRGAARPFQIIVYPDTTASNAKKNFDFGTSDSLKLGFTELGGAQVPIIYGVSNCGKSCCVFNEGPDDCVHTTDTLQVMYKTDSFSLPKPNIEKPYDNEEKRAIAIQVPKGTLPGTYVFDVFVIWDSDDTGDLYCKDVCNVVNNVGGNALCNDLAIPTPNTAGVDIPITDTNCFKTYAGPNRFIEKLYGEQVYKIYVEVP